MRILQEKSIKAKDKLKEIKTNLENLGVVLESIPPVSSSLNTDAAKLKGLKGELAKAKSYMDRLDKLKPEDLDEFLKTEKKSTQRTF